MTIQELAKRIVLHFHPDALKPVEVDRVDSDRVRLSETEQLRVLAWGNRFQKDVEFVTTILSSFSAWQPIETAPKNQSKVDLWTVDSSGGQYRWPDARRCYDGGEWPDVWVGPNGRYVNFSSYIDEDGDECLSLGNVPHKKARGWIKATHWRYPPPAPGSIDQ